MSEYLFKLPSVSIHKEDTRAGLSPLAAAVNSGQRRMVEWVLRHKAQLTSEVIIMAVEAGVEAVLELLLSHGADLSVRNTRGQSLLHLAASRGHCDILRRLLEAGADLLSVTEADSEGLTPLTSAILGDQAEAARLLLLHSGSGILEAVDSSGRSALDIAIYQGSTAMVELLLDSGANMEKVDERGVRPLDRVIGFGNAAIVTMFLRKGAKLGPGTWIMAAEKPEIQ